MQAYSDLVNHVIKNGTRKENRTGIDTISTFNYNYELGFGLDNLYKENPVGYYHLGDGFPLLTTKKISWKNIVVEMLWFLSGDTKIDILNKHKCKVWQPWADARGEVPSAYGSYWRHFPIHRFGVLDYTDQIKYNLDTLCNYPMSRRLVVVAWEPGNAHGSKLPPCHFAFLFNVQIDQEGEQRLCLHLTQRSCDIALGVPYNIASYSLLLMLFSKMTGIKPGIFAHTLCDAHIYTKKADGSMEEYDHIPGLLDQVSRTPKQLPTLHIDNSIKELEDIENLMGSSVKTSDITNLIRLDNYKPHGKLKFKVAV